MMRRKPLLTYNGLTVVLRNPSRFDLKHNSLLSANGGILFSELLSPELTVFGCDIRVAEDKEPLLDGTRAVLLLGQQACDSWLGNKDNTLNEIRGYCHWRNDVCFIPSYFPQDAKDIVDWESSHNEGYKSTEDDDKEVDESDDKRKHGKTKRRNFRFWLSKDIDKVKRILQNKIPSTPVENPEYVYYPSSEIVIKALTDTQDKLLFFDVETDEQLNILCFAFSYDTSSLVYCVPCLSFDYSWAYSNLHHIYRSLCIAIEQNIVVAHNGANFDFLVLANKYRIGIKRVKDTMLQQHRCFMEAEKSLGHCISMWCYRQEFHKDKGDSGYYNSSQMRDKCLYCGEDVYTMKLIYYAQIEYAKKRPGLLDSFEQVNSAIKPYLITTLQGIRYDEEKVREILAENDQLMMEYIRIINWFVGSKSIDTLKRRFKSSLPSSNPQMCIYFHEMLGYPVVGKGKPSKKDGQRKPSLNKDNLYKLKLQFNNPVIDLAIAYRETQKESGALKFNSWNLHQKPQLQLPVDTQLKLNVPR